MTYSILENRAIIKASGKDLIPFLQGIITNDANLLALNNSIYTLMLTPQGKFLSDFFISLIGENNALIDLPKNYLSSILGKLKLYKLRADVQLEDLSDTYRIVSITNKEMFKDLDLHKEGETCHIKNSTIFIDPRTHILGIRGIIHRNEYAEILAGMDEEKNDYNYRRINAAIPEGEVDLIPDKSFPLEYGMDNFNTISFNKGCYVGQELTARTKHRGTIRKQVAKVYSDKELPSLGTPIYIGESKIGMMCSSVKSLGLALIRAENYHNASKEEPIKCGDCILSKIEII